MIYLVVAQNMENLCKSIVLAEMRNVQSNIKYYWFCASSHWDHIEQSGIIKDYKTVQCEPSFNFTGFDIQERQKTIMRS